MTDHAAQASRSLGRESGVAVLNGLNIGGAFAAQVVIYRVLGVSTEADAYFATVAFPQLVLAVTTVMSTGVLVPMLAPATSAVRDQATVTVVTAVLGVLVLPVSIAYASAGSWAPLLFPGLADRKPELLVELMQLQLLSLPLMAASMVFTAHWQARERFARAEAVNLALTLVTLAALLLLLPLVGVVAAAWLMIVRYGLQAAILGAAVNWRTATLSRAVAGAVWRKVRLLLAGNAYFKSDLLVDRYLLSSGATGSLALFSLAQTVFGALAGVIGQAWGNTAVPRMATAWARRDQTGVKTVLRRNLTLMGMVSFLVVPAVVAGLPPLLEWLTNQSMQARDGSSLWMLLMLLSGVPLFGAVGALVTGCFYALGDTRTPTLISAGTFTLFIVCKVWIFSSYGLYAFCALTSVYYALNAFILHTALRRRLAMPGATP